MAQLRSNVERAKNASLLMKIMLAMTIVVALLEVVSVLSISGSSYNFNSGVSTILIALGIVGLIVLIVQIVNIVLFIMWFRRAYYNLHLIYKSGLRYSEGWAAGAWFVPIFNLFGPYQIASDLFTKTENKLVENNLTEGKPQRHSIKGWWWGLWIASSITAQVGNRVEDLDVNMSISIVSSLISIGALIMCIKMINEYHSMEVLLPKINNEGYHSENDELLDAGI